MFAVSHSLRLLGSHGSLAATNYRLLGPKLSSELLEHRGHRRQ